MENYLNRKTNWLKITGAVLIFVAIILLFCFFMRGETKVDGKWTVEQTSFLTCEISGLDYPIFEYDNSRKKTIKINSTLSDENVKTISLMYTLEYDDEKSAIDSENLNRIAMNNSFAKDNLGFDALGLKFSKFSNGLQMSLFVDSDPINSKVTRYFMLGEVNDISVAKIQEIYEAQGFICQRKN